jgi:hypothetical protein
MHSEEQQHDACHPLSKMRQQRAFGRPIFGYPAMQNDAEARHVSWFLNGAFNN